MDVRLSAEQRALRDSAAQLVGGLAPRSVRDLGDAQRSARLDVAVSAAGWRDLRTDDGHDQALASAVETALIAQELGRGLADTSFLGPTLAADLRRLTGAPPAPAPETVALVPGLSQLATVAAPGSPADRASQADLVAIDAAGCTAALLLVDGPAGYQLGRVDLPRPAGDVDLTRSSALVSSTHAAPLPGRRPLTPAAVVRWTAFAIAMTCADLVGHDARRHPGLAANTPGSAASTALAIGSFQAVQHLLADAFVAMEGSRSVALHAAWAVDALAPGEALARPPRWPRPTAPGPRARCARPRSRCTAASATPGSASPTSTCAARCCRADVLGGVGREPGQRVLDHHGIGGRRWTSVTRRHEAAFRLRLRAWLGRQQPGPARVLDRRRVLGRPGRPGTSRSTTAASSACPGRTTSAARSCRPSTT